MADGNSWLKDGVISPTEGIRVKHIYALGSSQPFASYVIAPHWGKALPVFRSVWFPGGNHERRVGGRNYNLCCCTWSRNNCCSPSPSSAIHSRCPLPLANISALGCLIPVPFPGCGSYTFLYTIITGHGGANRHPSGTPEARVSLTSCNHHFLCHGRLSSKQSITTSTKKWYIWNWAWAEPGSMSELHKHVALIPSHPPLLHGTSPSTLSHLGIRCPAFSWRWDQSPLLGWWLLSSPTGFLTWESWISGWQE